MHGAQAYAVSEGSATLQFNHIEQMPLRNRASSNAASEPPTTACTIIHFLYMHEGVRTRKRISKSIQGCFTLSEAKSYYRLFTYSIDNTYFPYLLLNLTIQRLDYNSMFTSYKLIILTDRIAPSAGTRAFWSTVAPFRAFACGLKCAFFTIGDCPLVVSR